MRVEAATTTTTACLRVCVYTKKKRSACFVGDQVPCCSGCVARGRLYGQVKRWTGWRAGESELPLPRVPVLQSASILGRPRPRMPRTHMPHRRCASFFPSPTSLTHFPNPSTVHSLPPPLPPCPSSHHSSHHSSCHSSSISFPASFLSSFSLIRPSSSSACVRILSNCQGHCARKRKNVSLKPLLSLESLHGSLSDPLPKSKNWTGKDWNGLEWIGKRWKGREGFYLRI